MAITTLDALVSALGNNSSRVVIDKASIANAVAGQFYSLWRATGQPGQGAIPTTAATCNHSTVGTMNFAQQTAPATSYFAYGEVATGNAAMTVEVHDRLAHMGGLSGTSIASQTVNVDLDALKASDNVEARIGSADYSDVQWWMEWYTDTGATASSATINVTFNDGSSANLTAIAVGGTAIRASRLIALNGLIQAADSGKFIRDINTVILSSTTGTAGNFGFTATRLRTTIFCPIANAKFTADWAALGLPEVRNSSALFPVVICSTTTTGVVRGGGKICHG